MNKLMMAAVTAALAIGANAASLDWSVTVGSEADRQKQFMFFDATDKTTVLGLLDAGGTTGASTYEAVSAYAFSNSDSLNQFATSSRSSTKKSDIIGIDKGTDIFMVFFDTTDAGTLANGTGYRATDSISTAGWIYDMEAVPPEASPGNLTIPTTYAVTGTIGAPEPTSGMLLLLGMGALALRRRRA